ncbi:hypothetical protein Val02_82620 [Virgisporangium aliadipatigenens]|uniref:Immunity protein 35 domain-containing protein n=1 Tax=Virgisporangium aliadipatigenens TaxID=741659 RepID=A0A8J3YTR5_9ACTN|nr:hypothetical protein [Virgisporangium aliadipatigenens]GIJ51376.1 hypothetical protein Val02_82620 [Virgisporangium aliadipatigenens]
MIDDSTAAAIAATWLDAYFRQSGESPGRNAVRTAPEYTFKDGKFLVVPWNSAALLDHGDEEGELAGNWPIMVDLETGRCRLMEVDEYDDLRDRGFFV